MGIFDFFKKKKIVTSTNLEIKNVNDETNKEKTIENIEVANNIGQDLMKTVTLESQKIGYTELINLCLGESKKAELIQFVNDLKDFNGDSEFMTTLNFVMNYFDNNNIHFIMGLDCRQDAKDLTWRIKSSLRDNFNLTIELPNPEKYGERASVSYPNVFKEYDNALSTENLKIGFIDTESDEYVIFIFNIKDEIKIIDSVIKIGYKFFDTNSSEINSLDPNWQKE